jgi:hypothetical protein
VTQIVHFCGRRQRVGIGKHFASRRMTVSKNAIGGKAEVRTSSQLGRF